MKVIFVVDAYEQRNEMGQLIDTCQIEVYANTEKEALDKAKKYIKKSFYRVRHIIEKESNK